MASFDVVHDPYYGSDTIGEIVKYQGTRLFRYPEPLPVGMFLCREMTEKRMAGVYQKSHRSRRNRFPGILADGLEHAVVPVIGLEKASYGRFSAVIFGWHEKNLSAVFKGLKNALVHLVGEQDSAGILTDEAGVIDPDVPGVDYICAFNAYREDGLDIAFERGQIG